jgi:hypothetical protein
MVTRQASAAAKKRKARQGRQEITFHIEVEDGNATVTPEPRLTRLSKSIDYFVKFTSNHAKTAILFKDTPPIAEAKSGEPLQIGTSLGFFKLLDTSKSHRFECGFINSVTRKFSSWGGDGGTTPPEF